MKFPIAFLVFLSKLGSELESDLRDIVVVLVTVDIAVKIWGL